MGRTPLGFFLSENHPKTDRLTRDDNYGEKTKRPKRTHWPFSIRSPASSIFPFPHSPWEKSWAQRHLINNSPAQMAEALLIRPLDKYVEFISEEEKPWVLGYEEIFRGKYCNINGVHKASEALYQMKALDEANKNIYIEITLA